jgi:poly-gamma-glutamate synthesis protein (capsule biosynthesis protein)
MTGRSRIAAAGAFVAILTCMEVRGQDSAAVVLRFGGDVLLAEHYERAAGESAGRAFAGFDLLRTADIAMVNLECPVTTRGTRAVKPFTFRMHPRFTAVLAEAGIDLVNLANNHIFDFGAEGLFDTFLYLDSANIRWVGAGRNRSEAHHPVVLNVRGLRIGFLGYYGGGEAPGAGSNTPGVARRELRSMAADILALRDSTEYVVVNLHWGTEKADFPESSQRAVAHALIDAGANLVVGHHPHVLQGIERYREGVIAYSLGNLLFGGNSRHTYTTALLEVAVKGRDVKAGVIPVGVRRWQAMPLAGDEADAVVRLVRMRSSRFSHSIFSNP